MSADAPDALDCALRYAAAGYRIIPVKPRGKIPLTSHGALDASTDAATIRSWWGVWPEANIGLTLGGLAAIDVDPRNGGSLDFLPHSLPDTCVAKTGGGGWHYLFREANGARYPGSLGAGIDVKSGPDAYIVVEPSLHASGEKYCWLDESEPWTTKPAAAPEWLALSPGQRANGEDPAGAIPEGGRNLHLTSLAGTMQKRSMSLAAILAALLTENTNRCKPPLGDDEVRKIAESVGRYAPGDGPKAEADSPPIDILRHLAAPPLRADDVPEVLARFAQAHAMATGFDISILLTGGIVAAAAMLSDGVRLCVSSQSSWFESARLWACPIAGQVVARHPGSK